MSGIDYSKWSHIEVSDDEDDTHPNIDTPSLFRWRHKARLERDAEWDEKRSKVQKEYKASINQVETLREKLKDVNVSTDDESAKITKQLKDAEKIRTEVEKKKLELDKDEKKRPWNIDNICHEGTSKTVINKVKEEEPVSDDADFEKLQEFVGKNEKLIKTYGMHKRPDDTMRYLLEHSQLVCEETANHLVLWCIDLAIEEKEDLFNHVSHQTVVMQFLLELAKSLKRDPRSCIRPFFAKFKLGDNEYMAAFNDELQSYRSRIKNRAQQRIQEAMEKYEEEEKQKRLGAGGLDPVEVFQSLPEELKECFEKQDKEMLTERLSQMDRADADYHLERCTKSGLWVSGEAVSGSSEPESETYETIE